MIWHRMRGHQIHDEFHHVNTSRPFEGGVGVRIEAGRTNHVRVCSCGTAWLHVLVNPLSGKWAWL